ncbi:FecCD family ABC transporter permease [Reinekea blandensis]|uniref:Iron(III) dicitrate transport system permease protein n=1 Tax=Reinekea blandensis MED297 TaxID=314283 RepID=A4BJ34_9GAMM|nr:iron ABC transporter permease [Reinekea blandensis]EAR07879.1 iron(III) dicitrate transport system permease protein [Reinekea sp. MED297] [Reinekea blandensis MED297]
MNRTQAYSASGLLMGLGIVLVAMVWHLSVGAKSLPFGTVLEAFLHFDEGQFNHIIVRDLRLPRALIAALVGASLAVAGALMQGVTRNPLADPALLGLMAGASLAAVLALSVFDLQSQTLLPVIAAVGALLAAILVWTVASRAPGGATPLSLTLSGAALSAFFAAIISVLHLLDQQTFDALRGWLVGSVAGRDLSELIWSLPWMLIGLAAAIVLAPSVTALSMGDEQAAGLGIPITRRKAQLLLCVVVLTASSVAMAGPLGFIGLVIPHLVRLFIGSDYRWIIPYSALFGAAYLLGVDVIARLVVRPQEIATGLITAMLGAPLLIYLVRSRLN